MNAGANGRIGNVLVYTLGDSTAATATGFATAAETAASEYRALVRALSGACRPDAPYGLLAALDRNARTERVLRGRVGVLDGGFLPGHPRDVRRRLGLPRGR